MKTKSTKLPPVVLALFLFASGLPVQAVNQILMFPEGKQTICGLNVVNPPLYTGTLKTILGSSAPTYTCFNPPLGGMRFTIGKFYTIEFPNGVWARIVSGSSGGITIRTSGLFGPEGERPPVGTPFIIRQVMAVADVFGDTAPSLKSGPLGTADEIQMPNGDIFFYDGDEWRRKSVDSTLIRRFQSEQPIYFVQGFAILRRGLGTGMVTVTGDVKTTPTWMQLNHPLVRLPAPNSTWSLVSTVTSTTRPPPQLDLASCGLRMAIANPASDLLGTAIGDPFEAERVVIQDLQQNANFTYFYFTDPSFDTWVQDDFTPSNSIPLPSAVRIVRKRPSVLIKWNP
jgi:hypothetical protein